MDQIAWDLGDPAGAPKEFNQPCSLGAIQLSCKNWHPMKGPMTTQTLVGTIGTRPLHWRGDRENLAAFGGAFMSLMGSDHELPPDEMDEFEAFLATIAHPPNPHRRADNSLLDEMIIRNRLASPSAGLRVFRETPSDRDLLKCIDCHGSDTGALSFVVGGQILAAPQQAVVSPLGSTYEKAGFDLNSRNNSRGFGFTHDGAFDTIENFLKHEVFTLPTDQHRLDLEAFVLSFSTETHAAVGMQVTLPATAAIAGARKFNPVKTTSALDANENRLSLLRRLADEKAIGLVAHGRIDGAPRGYAYLAGQEVFQSDRADETITFDALTELATFGNPLTFTAVPVGTEIRIGIDRDNDGLYDADDAEPANPNPLENQINALSRIRTQHP
ncbi:MAG: hypothetical protein IPK83_01825 [Planctomycetes bacterium]|nr:hypothetical protein [Planctomycetota bacterium]